MKQVDADGLELITVNGGELKPTQGGGETPSMATDCDAASPTQGAADFLRKPGSERISVAGCKKKAGTATVL